MNYSDQHDSTDDSSDSASSEIALSDGTALPAGIADRAPTEIPWPCSGDRALRPGHWQLNACMPGEWSKDRWYGYVEGYRRAAAVLLEQVREERADLDVLIYPFVFLWRQHIELQLKCVIAHGQALSANTSLSDYPKHHRIAELWRDARAHILREETKVEPECRAVDQLIADLAQIDPDSFEFRYPEDKKGRHTLANIGPHINFGTFHEALLKVSTFLECGIMELSSRLDYIREREREACAEYDREVRSEYDSYDT